MSDDSFANLAQLNFGELLVAEVFKKLINAKVKDVTFYKVDSFDGTKNIKIKRCENNLSDLFEDNFAEVNANLNLEISDYKITPDAQHQVDVCLKLNDKISNNHPYFPIEVKLGGSGGAESFPSSFMEKWKKVSRIVKSTKKNQATSKNEYNLVGNMISLLDSDKVFLNNKELAFKKSILHQSKSSDSLDLLPLLLNDRWGIVIREKSIKGILENLKEGCSYSKKFEKLQYIFIFEDLWRPLKENNDTLIIKECINKQIDEQFELLNASLDKL